MKEQRSNGRVIRLRKDKGFGFIDCGNGEQLFFHASGLDGVTFEDLDVGDGVSFQKVLTGKGPRAVQVRLGEKGA